MKKDSITYTAIFSDGSFVEKETLEEISFISGISFLLEIQFNYSYTTSYGNTYNYFWFKPIDPDGKPVTIKIGEFEIIDIGPEKGSYYPYGISLKIRDIRQNTVHDFKTKNNGLTCFRNEIFPLLNKLNELGNWSNYEIFMNSRKAEEKITELQKEIEELKVRIEKLLLENEELKLKVKEDLQ